MISPRQHENIGQEMDDLSPIDIAKAIPKEA
jgi:hypothetical protein